MINKIEKTKLHTIRIYMYEVADKNFDNHKYDGWIKIGQTHRKVEERIYEQFHSQIRINCNLLFERDIKIPNENARIDDKFRNFLFSKGYLCSSKSPDLKAKMGNEWCKITKEECIAALDAFINNTEWEKGRTKTFKPRDEQKDCIEKTYSWFINNPSLPKFLWNCKMRFGKTITAYWLCKKMGFKRILITTFKPATSDSWRNDLLQHKDFAGWKYVDRTLTKTEREEAFKTDKTLVCFSSLQDLLGRSEDDNIKEINKIIYETKWDLVIFDEYHFGAWRDKTLLAFDEEKSYQELDNQFDDDHLTLDKDETIDNFKYSVNTQEGKFNVSTKYKLYLSGTPFRALYTGEFLEAQIFSWTYQQEQDKKREYSYLMQKSPYIELPQMIIATYKITSKIKIDGYSNQSIKLNNFFEAKKVSLGFNKNGIEEFTYKFKNHESVMNWLRMIKYKLSPLTNDDERSGYNRPVMPFGGYDEKNHLDFEQELKHTLWLMNDVASCEAMYQVLNDPKNSDLFKGLGYKIVPCFGNRCGCGADALIPVRDAIGQNPKASKTIILTCGKLTTGVTIPELNGVLMLCDCKSAEKYMQCAFRCQSPWFSTKPNGEKIVYKDKCYVIDFKPNRTLEQIKTYSIDLDTRHNKTPTEKLNDFVKYLQIFSFDGLVMKPLSPEQLIQTVLLGFDVTNLAKRFYEHRLINMSDDLIKLITENDEVKRILDKIDVYRKFGSETISEIAAKAKKAMDKEEEADAEKKKTTDSEKKKACDKNKKDAIKEKYKARRLMKDKLGTFLAKLPIFMYLNNFREERLDDVIKYVESDLFQKITNLTIKDFILLDNFGFFDKGMLDDTVLLFRVFEEPSLEYLGFKRNANRQWGLFKTTISDDDFNEIKKQLKRD